MNALKHISDAPTLSHAYMIRAVRSARGTLEEALAARGAQLAGNPDYVLVEEDSLSVEHARSIASFSYVKSVGERKYIVIACDSMTNEAQHALLKAVEEGSGHSIFFFIIPPGAPVLPTLLSRCVVIRPEAESVEIEAEGEAFLAMNYAERLTLAELFTKNHDREGARRLVRSLLALSKEKRLSKEALRDLIEAEAALTLSGSSPKSVLSHLALTLQ